MYNPALVLSMEGALGVRVDFNLQLECWSIGIPIKRQTSSGYQIRDCRDSLPLELKSLGTITPSLQYSLDFSKQWRLSAT
jgi:hypothetical protein